MQLRHRHTSERKVCQLGQRANIAKVKVVLLIKVEFSGDFESSESVMMHICKDAELVLRWVSL